MQSLLLHVITLSLLLFSTHTSLLLWLFTRKVKILRRCLYPCFRVARDLAAQMLSYDSRERTQVSAHPLVSCRSTSIAQTFEAQHIAVMPSFSSLDNSKERCLVLYCCSTRLSLTMSCSYRLVRMFFPFPRFRSFYHTTSACAIWS